MRLITSLAAVCLVALVVPTTAGPDVEKVRDALRRAEQINTLRRDMDSLNTKSMSAGERGGCPLEKFKGKRRDAADGVDTLTNDAIAAAQLLRKEGFTTAELADETVTRELTRQLTNCPTPTVTCPTNDQYRTIDGSCNNEENPSWGMAGTAQGRDVSAAYEDTISEPRINGVGGRPLPNPRRISNTVHVSPPGAAEIRGQRITLHTFQMGQFNDHDLIKTPSISSTTDCCASTDTNECMPIRIRDQDSQFPDNYCMSFKRSAPIFCGTRREQINSLTSYIDASNVYGSSAEELAAVRDGGSPFLKTAAGNRLPVNTAQDTCISNVTAGFLCSLAGDGRVDTTPGLSMYHTLFVREHNRIANVLRPNIANDETLFQETRKIVIGVMQKIVYDEYLASFISPTAMSEYKLSSDESYEYDDSVDATITNGFGIAYRMGHTWIPREFPLYDQRFNEVARFDTDAIFLRPDVTYFTGPPQGLDGLSLGMTGVNSPATDRIVEEVARSRLFINGDVSFDLAALNIQRARDHGLPSYNEYRKDCGLSNLTRWDNIPASAFVGDTVRRLRDAGYESPEDVDLFTGIIAETRADRGALGPVGECILGRQFRALKFGDRYWYQGRAVGFDRVQAAEIRKASLASLLCDNFRFTSVNSPNAFLASDPRTTCANVQRMNLTLFAEQPQTTTRAPPQTQPPRPPPQTQTPPPPQTQPTRPPPNGPRPPPPNGGGAPPPRPRSEQLGSLLEELIHELEAEEQKAKPIV